MNRQLFKSLLLLVAMALAALQAQAQVARVFLSGTGSDAGDCSNAATPCRSLQGAINQCPLNGQVIVTTSGGFGTATITQSVTIDAPSGVVAFNARTINVNIPTGNTVTIRGLSMNGAAFGDLNGILFNGNGTLIVQNCIIGGFGSVGLYAGGKTAIVSNSEFRNNGNDGVRVDSGFNSTLLVENCRFENNSQAGVLSSDFANTIVRNSFATNGLYGFMALSNSLSNTGALLLDHCVIAHNTKGIYAAGGGGIATVRVSDSTIYDNDTGMSVVTSSGGTASIVTYQNNRVYGNGAGETFSGTATPF